MDAPTDLHEYAALVAKVDAFCEQATRALGSAITCHTGCAACCRVELSVCQVEAAAIRAFLLSRAVPPGHATTGAAQPSAAQAAPGPRCIFLDGRDRCGIYPVRPLVCRTQGLPLRYPPDLVPAAAVRWRRAGGDVVACPLNLVDTDPPEPMTLDVPHLDALLSLVNRRHCEHSGADPLLRVPLRSLPPP